MVNSNAQEVLREIAKQMHAGVRKCAVYDANGCTLDPDASNAAGILTVEGQPFFEKTSFVKQGRKVRMFANEIFIKVRISHVFDITPISVNSSNKNDFQTLAGKVKAGGRAYVIPEGRTIGVSGSAGLAGGVTGGPEIVYNYNTGEVSGFAEGGTL